MLLHDPGRLIRILTNTERPVQLIISGKAPPFDESGKALIIKWVQFIREHNLYHHIVFLSDYANDIRLQHHLKDNWNTIRFGKVSVERNENEYFFKVHLFLNGISTTDVLVQLYADGTNGDAPLKINMDADNITSASGQYTYQTKFSSLRPAINYTARVITACRNISIPL